MKQIRVVDLQELAKWVHSLQPSVAIGILLAGDRLSCVDEAAVIEVDGEIAGVCSISPDGETVSGEPTIVALYVAHTHRGQGYGRELLLTAIDRCRARGLIPVRVDMLSTPAKKIIESLPDDYQADLNAHDMSMGGAVDPILMS